MKTIMTAPEGATSSNIEGQPYEVDEDGEIEVDNLNHIPILERHGFTVKSQEGEDEDESESTEAEEDDDSETPKKKRKKRKNRRRNED
jgi:hypothetical protein